MQTILRRFLVENHQCSETVNLSNTSAVGSSQVPTPGRALSVTEALSPRPTAAPVQLQLVFVAPESLVSLVLAKNLRARWKA